MLPSVFNVGFLHVTRVCAFACFASSLCLRGAEELDVAALDLPVLQGVQRGLRLLPAAEHHVGLQRLRTRRAAGRRRLSPKSHSLASDATVGTTSENLSSCWLFPVPCRALHLKRCHERNDAGLRH